MPRVDGIRAPKKTAALQKPPAKPAVRPAGSKPVPSARKKTVIPPDTRAAAPKQNPAQRPAMAADQKTVWTIVIVIMVVIVIGWITLFANGNLTSGNGGGVPNGLQQKFVELWNEVKTGILKIKSINTNTNSNNNEERFKQLENSVFPQFINTNQQ